MNNRTVKRFTHIFLASQLVIFFALFISESDKPAKLKKLLPKEINKVKFETKLSDFLKTHPKAVEANEGAYDFRKVYTEDINSGKITTLVYYFDTDLPGQPLYEVIVNYKDEATMELQANVLLGASNYNGKDGKSKEWKFDIQEKYPLHSWVFRNKIIYAFPMLGTEWNENGNPEL